jgi:large conductance mechanosensitive channel
VFLNTVISFIILAFVIFLLVKQMNRMRRPDKLPANEKECPFCRLGAPLLAVRCPHCTSALQAA